MVYSSSPNRTHNRTARWLDLFPLVGIYAENLKLPNEMNKTHTCFATFPTYLTISKLANSCMTDFLSNSSHDLSIIDLVFEWLLSDYL